jgi:hypothetical protein
MDPRCSPKRVSQAHPANARVSFANSGLPGCLWRLFQVQYSRNPLRCQVISVSGLTMTRAERQTDQTPKSHV